ncbi:MAG: hypothetical protein K0S75_354 [Clostridia bacterium]|jgi:hypothetical protein|nr:hypothetical protein [Clostridia bacterium]
MSNLRQKLAELVEMNNTEIELMEDNNMKSKNNVVSIASSETRMMEVVPELAITISEAKTRIKMLQEFVNEMMVPGVDYGIISGCNKPSLYKSGAEKLCDVFGFSKRIEIINRVEEFDKGIFVYEVKATLISKRTNIIEAEGIGSCNNKEKKYRNMDGFTICNTVLKMAKKRALIDAVLSATRSSFIFSQDLEDIQTDKMSESISAATVKINELNNKMDNPKEVAQDRLNVDPIYKEQIHILHSLVKQLEIPSDKMKAFIADKYDVKKSTELNALQANELIEFLVEHRSKGSKDISSTMNR